VPFLSVLEVMAVEHFDIRARLKRIERLLAEGFRGLQSSGLSASTHDKMLSQWSARIRADTSLGFPHRKVLDFLLEQHDPATGQFKDVHFSALVRAARIGKNMAKDYLALLEAKGYIRRRSDGYRVFYALRRQ
jgi:hypothetical protein